MAVQSGDLRPRISLTTILSVQIVYHVCHLNRDPRRLRFLTLRDQFWHHFLGFLRWGNMNLCVYTANHDGFLEYAIRHGSTDRPIGFFSKKRWTGAGRYLQDHVSMPILMRKIEDMRRPFACTYIADLVEIRFSDAFRSRAQLREWLRKALWLQRAWYKSWYKSVGHAEEAFEKDEVGPGLEMETFYLVRCLKEIEQFPLSRLSKSS